MLQLSGGVGEGVGAQLGQTLAALGALGVGPHLEQALPIRPQCLPVLVALEQSFVALAGFAADVGVASTSGQVPVDIAGLVDSIEHLFQESRPFEGGAITGLGVACRLDLAGQDVGQALGIEAVT